MWPLSPYPTRVGEVAADLSGRIGDARGEPGRLRIQQQARGLAGAGGHHDGAAADLLLGASGFVDVGDGGDFAGAVGDQLTGHRAGEDGQLAGLHGGEDHGLARGERRGRLATAPALAAIMAGGAAVQRLGQHGHARGNARDIQFLAGLLDQDFMDARRNGRKEVAIGGAADALLRAGHADEAFGLVVVGRDLIVGDGPISAETVGGVGLEVVIRKTERNAAVVIGAAADDAGTEPLEFIAVRYRVGLAFDVPVSIGRAEIAPLLTSEIVFGVGTGAAVVHLVGQDVLLEILGGIEHGARFEKGDADAEIGEYFDGSAAAGAGADYYDVEYLRTTSDLEHV